MKTIYHILFIMAAQKTKTMKTQTTFKKTLQHHVSDIQRHTNRNINIEVEDNYFVIEEEGVEEVLLPFDEVFMPVVDAEVVPHKNEQEHFFVGDLAADCPHCGSEGYLSTGEHAKHGEDLVVCMQCANAFIIKW